MSTEINKNKKWTNRADIKKRSKKVTNEVTKNDIKSIVSSFVTALIQKHS
jgi:hypothetical protein